jgi:hypothetical protein
MGKILFIITLILAGFFLLSSLVPLLQQYRRKMRRVLYEKETSITTMNSSFNPAVEVIGRYREPNDEIPFDPEMGYKNADAIKDVLLGKINSAVDEF